MTYLKHPMKKNAPSLHERPRLYLNDQQRDIVHTVQARTTIITAGRAFGKGMLHAVWNRRNFERMPGSVTGFVSANIKRALTNTLPSMLIHWERMGLQRNRHWAIGIRPPKAWGWKEPIFPVQNYENVLSFYNGSIGYIISQDRQGTANGQSYDALDVDEAKFIKYRQFKEEALLALRGNRDRFGKFFYHHSMLITSDMPLTREGSWFMNYRDACDPELIALIRTLAFEIWQREQRAREMTAAGKIPPRCLRDEIRSFHRQLCQFRYLATDYRECSTLDNLTVLGEEYIARLRRDLPALTFQTSVLCKRPATQHDGFYSSMTSAHIYSAPNISHFDNLEYDFERLKQETSLMDADTDQTQPLCIGFDYNSNINWLVTGQPRGNKLLVLKSFYVKYERKLKELIDDFCDYYTAHSCRTVIYYYDHTAKQGSYATSEVTFMDTVRDCFSRRGWNCVPVDIGQTMPGPQRHLLLNQMFAGQRRLTPMFNRENNEHLLISIQCAGVRNGKKDKHREKLKETEEDLLEDRTDGSDAFDTLAVGCELFPQHLGGMGFVSYFGHS